MRVSYVEIYLERVNDLLQEGPRGGAVENLDVKEDPKKGFVVVGLHEEAVASMEEVMNLLSKWARTYSLNCLPTSNLYVHNRNSTTFLHTGTNLSLFLLLDLFGSPSWPLGETFSHQPRYVYHMCVFTG